MIKMDAQKELNQLYKDALFFHLVHKGYTKQYSKMIVNKLSNDRRKYVMN